MEALIFVAIAPSRCARYRAVACRLLRIDHCEGEDWSRIRRRIRSNETSRIRKAEHDRAEIAQGRERRAQAAATMSPEEVTALDHAREGLLNTQATLRRELDQQLHAGLDHERFHDIDRGGPGLER
jgi:hypothetical protein